MGGRSASERGLFSWSGAGSSLLGCPEWVLPLLLAVPASELSRSTVSASVRCRFVGRGSSMGLDIDVKNRELALSGPTAGKILVFLFLLKNGKRVPGVIPPSIAGVTGTCTILETMVVRFHFQTVRRVVPRPHLEIGNSTRRKLR